ncbi:hypothetical protein [Frondihabitans sucicola]|uniref:hypothetical protein n=1 Tax=Frondihabitans sucicola TaxID=1268041 RepID=UPI00257358B7|nr:hypothetical protein [Frondihabitans sucicola]
MTLREFARLASAVTDDEADADRESAGSRLGDRLRSFVNTAMSYRGLVDPPAEPSDDDIVDPYRRGRAAAEYAGREITEAVDDLRRSLRRAAC